MLSEKPLQSASNCWNTGLPQRMMAFVNFAYLLLFFVCAGKFRIKEVVGFMLFL